MMSDAEYQDWLFDTSRNDHRLLLVELDHSAGTVYLASRAWMSDSYVSYDDWMISEPEIEESLSDFSGVGDVDAINPDLSVNWMSYIWRGYPCRWYYGDDEWPRADFRPIANVLNNGCRVIDGRTYRFDLMDAGRHLRRTFTNDMNLNISAKSTIHSILTASSLPNATYYNVSNATRDYHVFAGYDDRTLASEAIRAITDSIGAHMRVSQTGDVEVFIPDTSGSPDVVLTADDIARGGISLVEVIPAYKRVTVVLHDGTEVTGTTGALTGEMDEEIRIETVIDATHADGIPDATDLLNTLLVYYSVAHFVWELLVFNMAGFLQKGDYTGVDHPELSGNGIVSRIVRAPLAQYSRVEITI